MSDDETSVLYESTESNDEDVYNSSESSVEESYDYEDSSDAEWNDDEESFVWELSVTQEYIILYIIIILTSATLIYGVSSWCVMKKFRNYRNFVFLNGILSNLLYYSILLIFKWTENGFIENVTNYLCMYFETAKCHWLVVISHMFYVDIVKVFNGYYLQRRFLKSCIFGWGLSLITNTMSVFINYHFYDVFDYSETELLLKMTDLLSVVEQILPLTVNGIFYFIIVFSLCRSFITCALARSNIWRRLYISTLIFILGDVLVLCNYVIKALSPSQIIKLILNLLSYFNPLILDIYFVVKKSNRETWFDFYVNRKRQRLLSVRHKDNEVMMHGIIICKSAENPEVLA